MNYPLLSEYVEAIKAAEDNFDQLKHLRPVLDEDGEPVMSSGNFAVVFKMEDEKTGKLYAVKCFLREQEGRAEAYRQIAEELEYVSSTFLTPIKYLDKELFVDTSNSEETEFPVLLMDWVEGQTLDKYIREHIDDQYELSLLAYQFSRLAMWLLPQPFAHGDLKPDNILVKNDGTLVLVDYDGMYVPAMKGQKARELGSPDFRHPSRTEADFDEHIDDFSLVSILLSLKATSLQPDLLEQYGASDRLLFSEKDYRNLSESQVMDALKTMMQDTELATLYSLFILSSAQNNLSQASFRLLNLKRPQVPIPEDINGYWLYIKRTGTWTDEYGVKYSEDKKFLVSAPNDIKEYVIKKGTKYIATNAFINCRELCSISLPNTLEVISNIAFLYCVKLSSITIPKSVKEIGQGAFEGCFSLTTIMVDKENLIFDSRNNCNAIIETWSNTLIAGCSTTIIPNSVTKIGKSAFNHCNTLKSIIIPESILEIDDYAFSECYNLEKIFIPKSVKKIGNKAFNRCQSLYSVTITNGVEDIGSWGFAGCRALTSIVMPNSINNIGKDLFLYCNRLATIYIPHGEFGKFETLFSKYKDKIVELNDEDNLSSIVTTEDLTYAWTDEYGVKYSKDRKRLLKAPEDLEEYSIRTGTLVLCDNSFCDCKLLREINIPNTIKIIGNSAFCRCWKLKSILIPESIVKMDSEVFWYCRKLSYVSFLSTIDYIPSDTFVGCGLEEFAIPEFITVIGSSCFASCNFKQIEIPENVCKIERMAFFNCTKLETVIIKSKQLNSVGRDVFKQCHSLKVINVPIGEKEKIDKLFTEFKDKIIEQEDDEICLAYCSENSRACEDKEYTSWQPHSKIIKKNGKLGVVIDDGITKKQIIPFNYDTWFNYDGYETIIREDFFENYLDYIGYFAFKNSDGTYTCQGFDKDGNITSSFVCEKFNPDSYSLHGKYILRYPKDEVEYDDIRRMRMDCDTYSDTSYLAFRKGNKWSLKSDDLKTTYIDFLECDGFGNMYWTPKGYFVEIKKSKMSQICLCKKNTNPLIFPDKYDYVSLRYFGISQNSIDSVCFEIRRGDKLAVCSNDLQNISPFIFDSVGRMINSTSVIVYKEINNRKVELVYNINGDNAWNVKDIRTFNIDEIEAVKRAEVVPSQFGNSVCFFMKSGGQTYIPLYEKSSLTPGDVDDLKAALFLTLCRKGNDDIYRVME